MSFDLSVQFFYECAENDYTVNLVHVSFMELYCVYVYIIILFENVSLTDINKSFCWQIPNQTQISALKSSGFKSRYCCEKSTQSQNDTKSKTQDSNKLKYVIVFDITCLTWWHFRELLLSKVLPSNVFNGFSIFGTFCIFTRYKHSKVKTKH